MRTNDLKLEKNESTLQLQHTTVNITNKGHNDYKKIKIHGEDVHQSKFSIH